MGVVGVSHITLSTADVDAAVAFYRDVLGFETIATWAAGAYLVVDELWLALVFGSRETRSADDYSHIAFHVDQHRFAAAAARIRATGAEIWQDNWTEGDSLYFTDPDGHRLEIHATTLSQRIDAVTASPRDGLTIADDAAARAVPRPSVADPRKPRRLACAPVGVFVVVVDDDDRVLVLVDTETGTVEVPNGAMEPGEEPADTARRELREEAGDIETGPMHACAASTVEYHPQVPLLLSLGFVCRYAGGHAVAGDDMAHCEVAWPHPSDIDPRRLRIPAAVDTLVSATSVLRAHP